LLDQQDPGCDVKVARGPWCQKRMDAGPADKANKRKRDRELGSLDTIVTAPGRRRERECVFSQKEKVCQLEAPIRSKSVVDSSRRWVVMVRIPWYGVPSTLGARFTRADGEQD
jgi:hypothetical protein